jgi:chromosome segregation ATPase
MNEIEQLISNLEFDQVETRFFSLQEQLADAKTEIERLRSALEKYADRGNWEFYDGWIFMYEGFDPAEVALREKT